jgi:hypothetical protein
MKKKQVVIYVVVMLVALLCTSSYATISGDIDLSVKAESSTLYAGDEFSITLSLKDMETTEGISAVEGFIDVNEDVFEDLTIESIVTTEGKVAINDDNVLTVYDADDTNTNINEGIIFNTDPVSKTGDYKLVFNFAKEITDENLDLITINFKIKEDAEPGEYKSAITYKLFKVFSDDASEKEELSLKAVTVIVSAPVEEPSNGSTNNTTNNTVNNTANNTTNNVTNNTSNNTSNNTTNNTTGTSNNKNQASSSSATTNNVVDNTVSKTKLPNTGYRLILIPVIVVAILGLVFYKKYTKYNKYNQ